MLTSPEKAADLARVKLAHFATEVSMVIRLNAGNEMINYEVMQEGTITDPVIYPRRVIEDALAYHAVGLVLIHKHPGTSDTPSTYDKHLTQTSVDATAPLDIHLLDHIIISETGYFSFLQHGLLR